jgi:hypothetical protein
LFAETLNELSARYSVIAGYVAILFGGARRSDDIDFITYPLTEDTAVGGFRNKQAVRAHLRFCPFRVVLRS